jgi:hypothetical protein
VFISITSHSQLIVNLGGLLAWSSTPTKTHAPHFSPLVCCLVFFFFLCFIPCLDYDDNRDWSGLEMVMRARYGSRQQAGTAPPPPPVDEPAWMFWIPFIGAITVGLLPVVWYYKQQADAQKLKDAATKPSINKEALETARREQEERDRQEAARREADRARAKILRESRAALSSEDEDEDGDGDGGVEGAGDESSSVDQNGSVSDDSKLNDDWEMVDAPSDSNDSKAQSKPKKQNKPKKKEAFVPSFGGNVDEDGIDWGKLKCTFCNKKYKSAPQYVPLPLFCVLYFAHCFA